jgi:hypothetical protein
MDPVEVCISENIISRLLQLSTRESFELLYSLPNYEFENLFGTLTADHIIDLIERATNLPAFFYLRLILERISHRMIDYVDKSFLKTLIYSESDIKICAGFSALSIIDKIDENDIDKIKSMSDLSENLYSLKEFAFKNQILANQLAIQFGLLSDSNLISNYISILVEYVNRFRSNIQSIESIAEVYKTLTYLKRKGMIEINQDLVQNLIYIDFISELYMDESDEMIYSFIDFFTISGNKCLVNQILMSITSDSIPVIEKLIELIRKFDLMNESFIENYVKLLPKETIYNLRDVRIMNKIIDILPVYLEITPDMSKWYSKYLEFQKKAAYIKRKELLIAYMKAILYLENHYSFRRYYDIYLKNSRRSDNKFKTHQLQDEESKSTLFLSHKLVHEEEKTGEISERILYTESKKAKELSTNQSSILDSSAVIEDESQISLGYSFVTISNENPYQQAAAMEEEHAEAYEIIEDPIELEISNFIIGYMLDGYRMIEKYVNELTYEDIKIAVKFLAIISSDERIEAATCLFKRMIFFKINKIHKDIVREYISHIHILCSFGIKDTDLQEADTFITEKMIEIHRSIKRIKSYDLEINSYHRLAKFMISILGQRETLQTVSDSGDDIIILINNYRNLLLALSRKLRKKYIVYLHVKSYNRRQRYYEILDAICNHIDMLQEEREIIINLKDMINESKNFIDLRNCFDKESIIYSLRYHISEFAFEVLIKLIVTFTNSKNATVSKERGDLIVNSISGMHKEYLKVYENTQFSLYQSDTDHIDTMTQRLRKISYNLYKVVNISIYHNGNTLISYLLNFDAPTVTRAYVFQFLRLLFIDYSTDFDKIYKSILQAIYFKVQEAKEFQIFRKIIQSQALSEALCQLCKKSEEESRQFLDELDLPNVIKRVYFSPLDTKYGRTLYGGYILLNINLHCKTENSMALAILTLAHEMAHYATRISMKGFNLHFSSPKNEKKCESGTINTREGGEALEEILFGKYVSFLKHSQIVFLLDEDNWRKPLSEFKKDFENRGEDMNQSVLNVQHRHGDMIAMREPSSCPYSNRTARGGYI